MSDRWTPTPEVRYVECPSCAEQNRPGSAQCARCGEGLPTSSGAVDPELARFVEAQERGRGRPSTLRALFDLRARAGGPDPDARTPRGVSGPKLIIDGTRETYLECPSCRELNHEGTARCARCGAALAAP